MALTKSVSAPYNRHAVYFNRLVMRRATHRFFGSEGLCVTRGNGLQLLLGILVNRLMDY
jgi:hypothetical protein